MTTAEPYRIVGELKRFSQRNSAFARARWDPTSVTYGRPHRQMEEVVAEGKPGYGREDFALHAGAWAGSRIIGYGPPPEADSAYTESAESAAASRHEPEDPTAFTERVKRAALFYGASLVGVTRVNPLWVYACDGQERPVELPDGVNTALVMAVEMDYEMIRSSPSVIAAAGSRNQSSVDRDHISSAGAELNPTPTLSGSAATGHGYSRMAFVSASLARYLSALGWQAVPCGNDTALSIPLAIDAGLGELGRNGLLLTERLGPRVRVCKVFTDAPLVPDRPVSFGATKTCLTCRRCAEACPVDAVPAGPMTVCGPTPSNNPGVLKWHVNVDRCLAFWRENGASCAVCISSCPYNHPGAPAVSR